MLALRECQARPCLHWLGPAAGRVLLCTVALIRGHLALAGGAATPPPSLTDVQGPQLVPWGLNGSLRRQGGVAVGGQSPLAQPSLLLGPKSPSPQGSGQAPTASAAGLAAQASDPTQTGSLPQNTHHLTQLPHSAAALSSAPRGREGGATSHTLSHF